MSPLLFSVFMSDIPILPGINYSLFADDLCFYVAADEYDEAHNNMQEALNNFHTWATEWRVNVNPDKSYVQYFTRKRITSPQSLKYGNVPIPYTKQHKFLGLHFDSPLLTWKTHIEELVRNCHKRINVMRASSSKAWGADRKTLLLLYKTFVRSKIDYGSEVYGSACTTLINKLEVIQNAALRIATGALRSTPVLSLRCETTMCPIKTRIEENTLKYYNKAHYLPESNPIKSEVLNDLQRCNGLDWPPDTHKKPLILRAQDIRLKLNLPLILKLEMSGFSPIPPWDRSQPIINKTLIIRAKNTIADIVLKAIFEITVRTNFPNYIHVYTDGSKTEEGDAASVGAAFHVPSLKFQKGWQLNTLHSVLGAELFAIQKGLEWVSQSLQPTSVLFCVDSMAALESLTARKPEYFYLVHICLTLLHNLNQRGFTVAFQWVPAHCGINGNEKADTAAKEASKRGTISNARPAICDYNSLARKRFTKSLQMQWQEDKSQTFLGKFKSEWQGWPWSHQKDRKIEVAMARLRLGHSRLKSHLYRLNLEDSPNCNHCGIPETINHFLIHCHRYYNERCILLNKLRLLGISTRPVDPLILLGGGNHDTRVKEKIAQSLIAYIIQTGRAQEL